MKGPGGYGRYDDDLAHVGCPWAKSDMTPCIARDGRLALAGNPPSDCVGCGWSPAHQVEDLAEAYPRARDLLVAGDPVTLADEFAALVREITEPGRPEE